MTYNLASDSSFTPQEERDAILIFAKIPGHRYKRHPGIRESILIIASLPHQCLD